MHVANSDRATRTISAYPVRLIWNARWRGIWRSQQPLMLNDMAHQVRYSVGQRKSIHSQAFGITPKNATNHGLTLQKHVTFMKTNSLGVSTIPPYTKTALAVRMSRDAAFGEEALFRQQWVYWLMILCLHIMWCLYPALTSKFSSGSVQLRKIELLFRSQGDFLAQ